MGRERWVASAEDFYRQRARALRARRWLPEELEEEFVSECLLLEVTERTEASAHEGAAPEPDRFRITTRALSAVRRSVRDVPWSVRAHLEREQTAQEEDAPAEPRARSPRGPGRPDGEEWDDVRFVASLMDVVCAMHWMVWLSRQRTKPKGSGYTVRALAAMVGVPRMRAARDIAALEGWFKRVWAHVRSGDVARVRAELERAEQLEARHFPAPAARGEARARTPLLLDASEALGWLVRAGIAADAPAADDLLGKAVALGLVGEGGRYLVTQDRQVLGLARGGLRDWVEDLGTLATCRQRQLSWNDLSGLQAMVSRHLQWIARVESRDLKNPEDSLVLRNISSIEELLAEHPLGLQYWGTAVAQHRAVTPALRPDQVET